MEREMKLEIEIPETHIAYVRSILEERFPLPGGEFSDEAVVEVCVRAGLMGFLAVKNLGVPFNSLYVDKARFDEVFGRILIGSIRLEGNFGSQLQRTQNADGTVSVSSTVGGGIHVKTVKPEG